MTFMVGIVILAIAGLIYQQHLASSGAYGATSSSAVEASNVKYMCPMRCVEMDEPGSCPVCGMDMVPVELAAAPAATEAPASYTCPMHPQIEQDHPGTCPICGMELVLKANDASAVDQAAADAVAAVKLSPLQAVLANVEPVHPSREHVEITVRAIGEVTIPEDKVNSLVSWQAGRIDNLVLRESGGAVNKGDHILDIYSEELVQAQEEYLLALDATRQLADSGFESITSGSERLLDAARRKLLRLGLTAEQLADLEVEGEAREHIPVFASHSGTVMEKKVTEGMYVREGEQLFTVADLSSVWVEVEIFESDMAKLRTGDRVKMFCPIHPGMVFTGSIELIEPSLDSRTRTHHARVVVKNADFILRPGMVMEAQLTVDHGELLMLPRNAILHTGDGDLVYVAVGENQWEPRRIITGFDLGELVEVVSGVRQDEAVAGTAVFLLDSEAQLKGVPRPIDSASAEQQQPVEPQHDHGA
jgi:Cu(I)/Ag(I) efflux system membrane fusion protein